MAAQGGQAWEPGSGAPKAPGDGTIGDSSRTAIGRLRAQRRAHGRLSRWAARAFSGRSRRRRTRSDRQTPQAQQAHRARANRNADRSGVGLSRSRRACGQRHVRRRLAECRYRHGHRRRRRAVMHDRRQRCDRQGRHLLSDDRQEASSRARDRRAEPSAVHLLGRLGRRVLTAAGRGLSGSRSFRTHLLQSGAHVGQAHSPDRWGRARPAAPTCRR
jgi:hypothetical protein